MIHMTSSNIQQKTQSIRKAYTGYIVLGVFFLTTSAIGITIATDTSIQPTEWEKTVAEKLAQYSRVQDAIKTLQSMDETDMQENTDLENFVPADAAKTLKTISHDIDSVISDIEKLQEERKENQENYETILGQVKKVIIDIKVTKNTVTDSVVKINLYTKRIVDLLANIQKTKTYIENTQETIIHLLPALYMIQNTYTNTDGTIDDARLLLLPASLSETLSYNEMMEWVSVKMDTLLGELAHAKQEYEKAVKDIHSTRKQLKLVTVSYRDKIRTLEEQKGYLIDFLSLYKGKKITLDKKITHIFDTKEQREKRIYELVQDITADRSMLKEHSDTIWANKPAQTVALSRGLRIYRYEETSVTGAENEEKEKVWYDAFIAYNDKRDAEANMLLRPTLPVKAIDIYKGDTIYRWWKEKVSDGIYLAVEQGQEIFSPADWYVYHTQDQDGIGNNRAIIVHKNGYISVFQNMERVSVQAGDAVKRGQIIGLVGGQPGTRWAGWFSTASHIDMIIFKHGIPVDPLDIIDLSIFPHQSQLRPTYTQKYEQDAETRNSVIDFSEVSFVWGKTDSEKRVNFLTQYAKDPYNDIQLREKAGEGTNIDIDMGICIGYAETSLGRHFASANNIGNVGNNDRGDRIDKDSPLVGARAIYTTLNNGYLGGYHTIYELSWYGNKEWAIYASSEYNWQKNVSRCLSTIKWYIVPEDYPFRTYNQQ